jgi:hypothetical protein
MNSSTRKKWIAMLGVVIVLSGVGVIVFSLLPESEWCYPPFLSRPDLSQAQPCRPELAGILFQISIDLLIWSIGILLLNLLVLWLRDTRKMKQI